VILGIFIPLRGANSSVKVSQFLRIENCTSFSYSSTQREAAPFKGSAAA